MKIVTYKCDECQGEILDEEFIELKSADEETRMHFRNNFENERRFETAFTPAEMHFCSKKCFMNFFWMSNQPKKQICEPIIEIGVDYGNGTDQHVEVHISEFTKSVPEEITPFSEEKPKRMGWPKGKPRGPKIADNLRKNKVQELPKPESVVELPKTTKPLGRKSADNDVFYQKLEFAKSLGYESISAAIGEIDKYEFAKQFEKSKYSK